MARLNITIPDELHARLERFRERMNLSETCAMALAQRVEVLEAEAKRELDYLEDDQIEKLIQRFKRAEREWFELGRIQGQYWAVSLARRSELAAVGIEYGWLSQEQAARWPATFDLRAACWGGAESQAGLGSDVFIIDETKAYWSGSRWSGPEEADDPSRVAAPDIPGLAGSARTYRDVVHNSIPDVPGAVREAWAGFDLRTYAEGWTDGAALVWRLVRPALEGARRGQ